MYEAPESFSFKAELEALEQFGHLTKTFRISHRDIWDTLRTDVWFTLRQSEDFM